MRLLIWEIVGVGLLDDILYVGWILPIVKVAVVGLVIGVSLFFLALVGLFL